MWNLLRAELLKLRRCQILLVGLVALGLCPLVQYGSQMIIEAEYRDPDYDIQTLFCQCYLGQHPDISAHFTGDDRRLAHGQGVFP